jgi:8-oxo-dGTP diphosphatase
MKKVVERIANGGVIINRGKVLIIQRASNDEYLPDLWEIPGGKREIGEKTIDSVKRELEEETGLKVNVGNPIDIFEYRVEKPEEIRDITQINFLVTPIDDTKVKLSSEHQNFAWITPGEIDKYNISKEIKETIKKAFKS